MHFLNLPTCPSGHVKHVITALSAMSPSKHWLKHFDKFKWSMSNFLQDVHSLSDGPVQFKHESWHSWQVREYV